ncbi:probable E3 ubiquitin-protein ligase EDA40 [Miscanthus floridulus]|uniref:probable E3 ubiquitin-protein ligase EDA40 n=1 Tax=Miscanthus floridulus TaxID=154761 RepID=UPI00345A95D5
MHIHIHIIIDRKWKQNKLAGSMAFNDDEKPATTPNPNGVNKQGLVTMRIPKYSKKDVALTVDSVTAMVEIEATSSTAVREGLDLVAVVDVSGSMRGHKIESVKKALQFVIMKLTPVDRLSIVTFESSAKRLTPLRSMTQAAQSDLKTIVGRLVADGGTDIKAGLDLGLAVLGDRVLTVSRTANIFLMSDGKPEGKSSGDPRQVDPGEVSVYTFGFGQGTDHKLLTDIAKKSSGGTYSTVPDGTNLSAPFAQLLGGLLTVVAQDVQLTLTPKTGDGDLDTMAVAPGTDYTQTTDANGVITIKFGTLFSGETRKVAVNFTLKQSSESEAYNATLAVARHSYAAEETRQPAQNIQRLRTPEPSSPGVAGSEERSVQAEEVRRQHADMICKASELADGGKLDRARDKIMDAQNALEDIMLDDGDRMVNALRAELLRLLEYMESQKLYNKLGHPYALATIISHGRQRAAGRGDEEVISLYVTPRMIAYLEQAKKFEENPQAPVPTADKDVEQELAANPLAAFSAPLAFYLENAIQALQAIQKIISATTI